MAGTKRKTKKKTLKQKTGIAAAVISVAIIVLSALADMTGLLSYEEMMTSLHLRDPAVSDADLTVHYIDVGQGDSILIMSERENILIDAGENEYAESVASYIRQQGVTTLDYIIATHPHSDHIGGLPYVMSQFETKDVIVPYISSDKTPSTVTYTRFLEAVRDNGLSLTPAKPGDEYIIGNAVMKVLGPCSDNYEDLNDYSVVVSLTHGKNSFLFMGDAEKKSEQDMTDAGMIPDSDILKTGHHGSNSSSGQKFLDIVTPEYAVISCGTGNRYNHPGTGTVERLASFTDKIFRTDQQGTIVIESDGENYNVIIKEG